MNEKNDTPRKLAKIPYRSADILFDQVDELSCDDLYGCICTCGIWKNNQNAFAIHRPANEASTILTQSKAATRHIGTQPDIVLVFYKANDLSNPKAINKAHIESLVTNYGETFGASKVVTIPYGGDGKRGSEVIIDLERRFYRTDMRSAFF